MTDWADHMLRGRRWVDAVLWTLCAAIIAMCLAAGTAFAMWLDLRAGQDQALEDAVLIDLASLPATTALAEVPEVPQPEAETIPPDEIEDASFEEPAPETPKVEPDTFEPPEPAEAPALADPQDALPQVASTLPEPTPPPKKPTPRPKKVAKAEPAPKKPVETKAAPQKAQAGTEAARKGSANAKERARWHAKVAAQLGRHLKRKSWEGDRTSLAVSLRVDGNGRITGLSLASSSGDAALDAAVIAHLNRLGKVTAPPDGLGEPLQLPVNLR
ncbi:MAG: TonB family protein [Gemmobacter sp.]